MTTKTSLIELKKSLSDKTKAELIEEITLLYKKFPNVKEYYQSAFSSTNGAVLDKYKEIINSEFLMRSNRPPKMRISIAKKAISDFKKISQSKQDIADLMLTYVEAGVCCSQKFCDTNQAFYNSVESMYEGVLKYLVKENLFAEFDSRLNAFFNTPDTALGFRDEFSYLYKEYQAMMPESHAF